MLKKTILLFLLNLPVLSCKTVDTSNFREGDIVFQTTNTTSGKAIRLATHSRYCHVGIVVNKDGKLMVLEAVQPVRYVEIEQWISNGEHGKYAQKRLKGNDSLLSNEVRQKMHSIGDDWAGKNYDLNFDWDDKELYCSELVWKLYKNAAGIEVGHLKKFKDYDFSNALVKRMLKKRYGNHIPMDETIIAPEDIYLSAKLETITEK